MPIDLEFNNQCVEAHNECRSLHGNPPVKLNKSLAESAQKWAEYLASTGGLKHSKTGGKYGENIAMKMLMGSHEYTGQQATSQWYSEIEYYDFNGPENQMRCGHFSQIVWKDTKEVGFGKAIASDGKMFSVGQYVPPGNFQNQWKKNIPPPVSGQIKIPSRDDIMGKSKSNDNKNISKQHNVEQPLTDRAFGMSMENQRNFKSSGDHHKKSSSSHGKMMQSSSNDPTPQNPEDRIVKKSMGSKTVNGVQTTSVTVVFQRSNGSQYKLTKETSQGGSDSPATASPNNLLDRLSDPMNRQSYGMADEPIVMVKKKRVFAAAPPSSNNRDDFDREQFQDDVLQVHNQLRNQHNAGRLVKSESLTDLAQGFAETLSDDNELRHPSNKVYVYHHSILGRNIARSRADKNDLNGTELVYQWYAEANGVFERTKRGQVADLNGGHFTQLIWKDSQKLGVGISENSNGETYVVCFYYPPGNIKEDFYSNVLPKED